MKAENLTYVRLYFIGWLVFPSLDQKPSHISQPAVRGLVHPQRVLQVTAIHPVAEVLALAVTPPGLPEDGAWEEQRPNQQQPSVPAQRRTGRRHGLYTISEVRKGVSKGKKD